VTQNAVIQVGDTKLEAPVVVGTEGERGVDIAQLPWTPRS
jgi:hypothetical protein